MTDFNYSIPLLSGDKLTLTFKSGTSVVFVGANGSGKSRLGVHFEINTSNYVTKTHRVSAQRALTIPSNVRVTHLEEAERELWYGAKDTGSKITIRWKNKPATLLLDDFARVLAALFADWTRVAAEHQRERRTNPNAPWPPTKIDTIRGIWNDTIRTRALIHDGGRLAVSYPETDIPHYPADEMSDRERVLVYLAGQCLHAPRDGVIIIDEPELHLHKAVLSRFWDTLESARPDCLFIYLTHDLDFAVSRASARKFAVLKYDDRRWEIKEIPEAIGLPAELTALILGSRKPILFVEGGRTGLDANIFGKLYEGFTVLPVGSCEEVIHLTNSYNAKSELHHFVCRGIIDRDGRTQEEIEHLEAQEIYVIEYAESENLLLAEPVMDEVAQLLGFMGEDAKARVEGAKERIFGLAAEGADKASIEYAKRRLGRALSTIGFTETKIKDLVAEVDKGVKALDVFAIYKKRRTEIEDAIKQKDYQKVLELCDHKGMVRQIGSYFDLPSNGYSNYVLRQLGSEQGQRVLDALRALVPDLQGSV